MALHIAALRESHERLGGFDPERQKNGLGSAVLEAILAETDAACLPVRLGGLKQSAAARFYVRHGFRRTHSDDWDDYFERATN